MGEEGGVRMYIFSRFRGEAVCSGFYHFRNTGIVFAKKKDGTIEK